MALLTTMPSVFKNQQVVQAVRLLRVRLGHYLAHNPLVWMFCRKFKSIYRLMMSVLAVLRAEVLMLLPKVVRIKPTEQSIISRKINTQLPN